MASYLEGSSKLFDTINSFRVELSLNFVFDLIEAVNPIHCCVCVLVKEEEDLIIYKFEIKESGT